MSKVAYNQHTEASLQTAKYKLQCRNAILPKFSLQLGAISFCSERRFCPFPTSVKAMENVRQSLLQKEFQSFYEREKFTAINSLQTATAIFAVLPLRKAQLHTAITPTTPFRGVGVVAVQCCAVSVSFFHPQQFHRK